MLKIENTDVCGWEHAIRGMRNPMNSWEKGDSEWKFYSDDTDFIRVQENDETGFYIGPNDQGLMKRLRNAGTDHRKFMRMITVYADIVAPLYWWKEFDTYKVGTVANSCSTMHKIAAKEFTLEDFSTEHLFDRYGDPSMNLNYDGKHPVDMMKDLIRTLNHFRHWYLETKDKKYWWQMIQLLPSSYNQRRTVMLNYEVLANIYKSRRNHKLDEWHTFCDWIEELPYSELITGPSIKDIPISNEIMEEAKRRVWEEEESLTFQAHPVRYIEAENGNLIIETKEGVTFKVPKENVNTEAWEMVQKLESEESPSLNCSEIMRGFAEEMMKRMEDYA